MIRHVEMFETADKQKFEDQTKAQEHVLDTIRATIDASLNPLQVAGRLAASDRFRIVMAIVPDVTTARELAKVLNKWVNYGDT